MKHAFLIAGLGLLGYCAWQQRQATSLTVVSTPTGANATAAAFNGGIANTSGGGSAAPGYSGGSPATNIGGGLGTSSTIPTPVTQDSPSALSFFGGGAAAHPLDF